MNVGAGDPSSVPGDAVNVCPSIGVPLIVGEPCSQAGWWPAATTLVGLEAAVALPELLLPVTWTTIVEPTSAVTSVYVELVASPMSGSWRRCVSQRCH